MINTLRVKKGEKKFSAYADFQDYLDNLNAQRASSPEIDTKDDFLLLECGNILSNFISYNKKVESQSIANAN